MKIGKLCWKNCCPKINSVVPYIVNVVSRLFHLEEVTELERIHFPALPYHCEQLGSESA